MSLKNRDEHSRWRNKTVAFRLSPEEDSQLEIAVKLTGLTKAGLHHPAAALQGCRCTGQSPCLQSSA
jgi:hypothetical protein